MGQNLIVTNKNHKTNQILDFAAADNFFNQKAEFLSIPRKKTEEVIEDQGKSLTCRYLSTENGSENLTEKDGRIGNPRKKQDYPNVIISSISKNIQERDGILRSLAVT